MTRIRKRKDGKIQKICKKIKKIYIQVLGWPSIKIIIKIFTIFKRIADNVVLTYGLVEIIKKVLEWLDRYILIAIKGKNNPLKCTDIF